MGKNTAVFGGLMKGVGDYMVSDAETKRQEAIARAKSMRDRQEKTEDREYESGLLSKTVTDEEGNIVGLDKTGRTIPTGVKTSPPKGGKGGKGPGYISPDDKRLWDATIQRHTTESTGGKKTDWEAVSATLIQQGRQDLASMAGQPAGASDKIDVSSREYREAQMQADAWVDEQANPLGLDRTDFKDHGGNREQARQAKTMEIYQQLTGKGGSAPAAGNKQQGQQPKVATPKQAKSDYKSADDVKAAMKSGKLTREQALSILRSQFGFK
jgi:hypothetical protein